MTKQGGTQDINYVQTEYFCESCDTNHFGNCPKIKVTLTTSTHTDTEELERKEAMTPTEQDNELREKINSLFESVFSQGVRAGKDIATETYEDFDAWHKKGETDEIMQLITADRKRVVLEARIETVTYIDSMLRFENISLHPVQAESLKQYLRQLEAQQEEI